MVYGSIQKYKFQLTTAVLAGLIPLLLPVVHMFVLATVWKKNPVDKDTCDCSCWDSIFKGVYDTGVLVDYSHVYFNSNTTTFKMWTATVFFVVALYEAFKHFFRLLRHRKIRWTMGALFLGSLHNLYYAWWVHWDYWNDDFYQLWNHQAFCTLTKGISTVLVLLSLDCTTRIPVQRLITIITIALFHIFAGGGPVTWNVIFSQGDIKLLRDVLFMTCDVIYAAVCIWELKNYAGEVGVSLSQILCRRSNLTLVATLNAVMFMFVIVFPSLE